MKNVRINFWYLVVLILLITDCECHKSEPSFIEEKPVFGEEITFILGDDKALDNPFYKQAETYYRYNKDDKTEHVVTSCQSLTEVQDYLIKEVSDRPWKLINLVSHGNQFTGLSVRIEPGGKRASPQQLTKYIDNSKLKELPNHVINNDTRIILHGCGLGNNEELLTLVQKVFSTKNSIPKFTASKHFEYYVTISENNIHPIKYQADNWPIYYRKGYKPSDGVLGRRLSKKYPNSTINWIEALKNETAYLPGEVFHYEYTIPLKWVFTYTSKDSIPELKSNKAIVEWVSKHPTMSQDLHNLNIPANRFNWWIRNVYVKNDDGTRSPALWIKGYCTILNVLRILPNEDRNIL